MLKNANSEMQVCKEDDFVKLSYVSFVYSLFLCCLCFLSLIGRLYFCFSIHQRCLCTLYSLSLFKMAAAPLDLASQYRINFLQFTVIARSPSVNWHQRQFFSSSLFSHSHAEFLLGQGKCIKVWAMVCTVYFKL